MITKKITNIAFSILALFGLISFANANSHSLHLETTQLPKQIEWNSQINEDYVICFNPYHNYSEAQYCNNIGEKNNYTLTATELKKIHDFYDGQTQLMIGWSIYWEVFSDDSLISVIDSGNIDYNLEELAPTITENIELFSDNYWDRVDFLISENDWGTLSMEEIDFILIKNGLEPLGDPEDDEFYAYSISEMNNLLSTMEAERIDGIGLISPIDFIETDSVIFDKDWETLSLQQIDEKLINAGLEPFGKVGNDPLYSYTPSQIDNLTDDEWGILFQNFEPVSFDPSTAGGNESPYNSISGNEEVDAIITTTDWDTLSMKKIDDKLKNNNHPPIGDPKEPLYNYSPSQKQNLSDDEWEVINREFEIYFNSFE